MSSITAIIIAKNEERVIDNALKSVSFCDEVIVLDSGSTDNTIAVANKNDAKVFSLEFSDFSSLRNYGMAKAESDWVFYVDADERVTKKLQEEIKERVKNYSFGNGIAGYYVKRKTYYFNKDWGYSDRVQRLFLKKLFIEWRGEVHETPYVKGKLEVLTYPLLHFTHYDLGKMVNKTNEWSEVEARLRFSSRHPKMSWWRFIRVMMTGFLRAYVKEKGYKNGAEGIMESIYQAFSMFITYAKLWEMQDRRI